MINNLTMQVNNALSNTDKLTAELDEVKTSNESTVRTLERKNEIIENLNIELNATKADSQKLSNDLIAAKLDTEKLKKEVDGLKSIQKLESDQTDYKKGKCS